jgi:hypothetical protein
MSQHPWRGDAHAGEPPPSVAAVQDSRGYIADRLPERCDEWCNADNSGSRWQWRHNGRSECWLEIDGISPWVEIRDALSAELQRGRAVARAWAAVPPPERGIYALPVAVRDALDELARPYEDG